MTKLLDGIARIQLFLAWLVISGLPLPASHHLDVLRMSTWHMYQSYYELPREQIAGLRRQALTFVAIGVMLLTFFR